MVHTLNKSLLVVVIGFLFSNVEVRKPVNEKENRKETSTEISKQLKDWIQADADKRIKGVIADGDKNSPSKVTTDCGYAYCTTINYQSGGSSSCTLNMTTARNLAVPPFSTICAAAGNFRYGIVYFGSAAQGAIYGPTGLCMEGSLTYTINGTSYYNQQPSYLLVYNVYNGPGGGATFVGHVSGNVVNIQCQ